MRPVVDVVIVNWNAGSQLRECLQSLPRTERRDLTFGRVVVVDNGSLDGSATGLAAGDVALKLINNPNNRGFAAACNQGAAGSMADYILFLNPDAQVFPDSIGRAVSLMETPRHAATGICGIQLVNEHGKVSRTCARLPTPKQFLAHALGLDRIWPHRFPSHFMTEWDHAASRRVDHVIGAFYLVRRPLFQALGGFDERFFVYLEDLDLSLRALRAGYGCFYLADAQAYHKGGGTSQQVKALRLFYAIQSRILYAGKHFDWWSARLVMLASVLVEPFIRLAFAAARGAGSDVTQTLQAYSLLWRRAGSIWRSAR